MPAVKPDFSGVDHLGGGAVRDYAGANQEAGPAMRTIPVALIPIFFAGAVFAATDPGPVTPFSPSGAGDPDAMACRAAQPLPGGGTGPQICMHNRIWAMLTVTGKDLAADGRTVVLRPMVDEPRGDGIAEAVTCRKPQSRTSSRVWRGPEICLTNAKWASLAAQQIQVTSDGRLVSLRSAGPPSAANNFPVVSGSYGPE